MKSRRRFSDADDIGKFMLLDLLTKDPVAGADDLGRPSWSVEDVQRFFEEGGRR